MSVIVMVHHPYLLLIDKRESFYDLNYFIVCWDVGELEIADFYFSLVLLLDSLILWLLEDFVAVFERTVQVIKY
jgi:hypothetical protein